MNSQELAILENQNIKCSIGVSYTNGGDIVFEITDNSDEENFKYAYLTFHSPGVGGMSDKTFGALNELINAIKQNKGQLPIFFNFHKNIARYSDMEIDKSKKRAGYLRILQDEQGLIFVTVLGNNALNQLNDIPIQLVVMPQDKYKPGLSNQITANKFVIHQLLELQYCMSQDNNETLIKNPDNKLVLMHRGNKLKIVGKPAKRFVVVEFEGKVLLYDFIEKKLVENYEVCMQDGYLEGINGEKMLIVKNKDGMENLIGLDHKELKLIDWVDIVHTEVVDGFDGDKWILIDRHEIIGTKLCRTNGYISLKYQKEVLPFHYYLGDYEFDWIDNNELEISISRVGDEDEYYYFEYIVRNKVDGPEFFENQ